MEKLFEIKKNLPVEYENYRSSIEDETIQRVQFDLTEEITLDVAQNLQSFFNDYFQDFSMSLAFDRNNITVQRQ